MRRTVTPSSAASFDALPDPVLLDIFARTDFATRHDARLARQLRLLPTDVLRMELCLR